MSGRKRKQNHHRISKYIWVTPYVAIVLFAAILFGCGYFYGRCTAPQNRPDDHDVVCYGGRAEKHTEVEPDVSKPLPWNLRLVNGSHVLPDGATPPELTELTNGQRVDTRIYEDLQQMMDAAREAGANPVICSSYRSHERQKKLFEDKRRRLREEGCPPEEEIQRAAEWVAQPGTSEHELGLALDIVDMSYQMLDHEQENTPTQQWLLKHSWEYGFVLRYPTDRAELTGVEYEPWHYRYVGREAAEVMHQEGLCLEEYLSAYYHVN